MAKRIFNLLTPIKSEKTGWDRAYDWLVGKAKLVVIGVEILVVVAFASKILVDNINKNKEEQLEELQNQIAVFAEDEREIRMIQQKDSDYRMIWNGSDEYADIVREVLGFISNKNTEIGIQVSGNTLTMSGSASSDLDELRELETALKNSELFVDAYVENLTQEQEDVLLDTGQYVVRGILNPDFIQRTQLTDE